MKILLFGANGQVGWELQRALAPLGSLTSVRRSGAGLCCDMSRPEQVETVLNEIAPDLIVNAAAYTAVDRAESEVNLAYAVNALAPQCMADWACKRDALLVHYSTDYVFDGGGSLPWREQDPTGPLSVYGASKLAGEQAVRESGARHLIFRTSWVYSARGGNFARTMLALARTRTQLKVVADQAGVPTGADLIADVTAHAIRTVATRPDAFGTYHLAPDGETNWCDYARFVFDTATELGIALKLETLEPIPTAQWPTPARRPLNSRLDTGLLTSTFDLVMPDWQRGVARMLEEIVAGEHCQA